MTGTQSSELAVRDHRSAKALSELEQVIRTRELPAGAAVYEDPEETSRAIVASILDAETIEAVERIEAEGWAEYLGVPMRLYGWHWMPSAFAGEGGLPIYFVVAAEDLRDGRRRILTTGSANVIAQLHALTRLGGLVGAVRQLASDETRQGQTVYFLTTPEGHSPTGHLVDPEAAG